MTRSDYFRPPVISDEDWLAHEAAQFAEKTDSQIRDTSFQSWDSLAQQQIDALNYTDPAPVPQYTPPPPVPQQPQQLDWAQRAQQAIQGLGEGWFHPPTTPYESYGPLPPANTVPGARFASGVLGGMAESNQRAIDTLTNPETYQRVGRLAAAAAPGLPNQPPEAQILGQTFYNQPAPQIEPPQPEDLMAAVQTAGAVGQLYPGIGNQLGNLSYEVARQGLESAGAEKDSLGTSLAAAGLTMAAPLALGGARALGRAGRRAPGIIEGGISQQMQGALDAIREVRPDLPDNDIRQLAFSTGNRPSLEYLSAVTEEAAKGGSAHDVMVRVYQRPQNFRPDNPAGDRAWREVTGETPFPQAPPSTFRQMGPVQPDLSQLPLPPTEPPPLPRAYRPSTAVSQTETFATPYAKNFQQQEYSPFDVQDFREQIEDAGGWDAAPQWLKDEYERARRYVAQYETAGAIAPPLRAAATEVVGGLAGGTLGAATAPPGASPEEQRERFRRGAVLGTALGRGSPRALLGAARQMAREEDQRGPGFYSQLRRVIQERMPNRASPDQVASIVGPQNGVKPDELKWTGFDDFLAGKRALDDPITKQEALDFLDQNQVSIQETIKSTEGLPVYRVTRSTRDSVDGIPLEYYGIEEVLPGQEPRAVSFLEVGEGTSQEPYQIRALTSNWGRIRQHIEELDDAAAMESVRPRYGGYTLPGAEEGSYRELLLTLPSKDELNTLVAQRDALANRVGWNHPDVLAIEQQINPLARARAAGEFPPGTADFQSTHWQEPNVLAHVRFNERNIDGKRTLFVEEIQSDWHQQGRQRGYRTGPTPPEEIARLNDRLNELTDRRWDFEQDIGNRATREQLAQLQEIDDEIGRIIDRLDETGGEGDLVPPAPFSKTWPELSLKRVLQWASENNYEQIAWPTGNVHAERYLQGNEQFLGQDVVDRIRSGMQGFYEKILPNTARKLGKKFGVEVSEGPINVNGEPAYVMKMAVPETMRADILERGQPLFITDPLTGRLLEPAGGIAGGAIGGLTAPEDATPEERRQRVLQGTLLGAAAGRGAGALSRGDIGGALQAGRGIARRVTGAPRTPSEGTWYHGTTSDFDKASSSQVGMMGPGYYMTRDPQTAGQWATVDAFGADPGANVRPLKISPDAKIVNEADRVPPDQIEALNSMDFGQLLDTKRPQELIQPGDTWETAISKIARNNTWDNGWEVTARLEALGYDGIQHRLEDVEQGIDSTDLVIFQKALDRGVVQNQLSGTNFGIVSGRAARRAANAANLETADEAYQRIDQMYGAKPQPSRGTSPLTKISSDAWIAIRRQFDRGANLQEAQKQVYNALGREPTPEENAYALFRTMAGRSKAADTQVHEDFLPIIQDLSGDERRHLVNYVTMLDNADKLSSIQRAVAQETMNAPFPRVAGEAALESTDRSLAARERVLPHYQDLVNRAQTELTRADSAWEYAKAQYDPQIRGYRSAQSGYTQDQYDAAVQGLEALRDAEARHVAARQEQTRAVQEAQQVIRQYQQALASPDAAVRAEARQQLRDILRARDVAAEAVGTARQEVANLRILSRDNQWTRIAGRYDEAIEAEASMQLELLRRRRADAQIRYEGARRAFREAQSGERAARRRIRTARGRLARIQASVDAARQQQLQERMAQTAVNITKAGEERIFSGGAHAHSQAESYAALERATNPETAQKIAAAADEIFTYSKAQRDALYDAGLLTDEVYQDWSQNFPHYIKSEIDDYMSQADLARIPTGKPLLTVGQLRSIGLSREGTEAARVNPLNTLIRQTFTTQSLVQRNKAAQAVLKMRENSPELQNLLKEVKGDYTLKKDEAFFSVYEKGIQRKFVGPKALEGIWQIDAAVIPTWMRFLATAMGAPVLRAGATGVNAAFILPNMLRDAQTYMMRTGGFSNPRQLGRSAAALGKAYVDLLTHEGGARTTAAALAGGTAGALTAPEDSTWQERAAFGAAGAVAGAAGSEILGRTALRGIQGTPIEDLSRVYRQGGGQFSELSNLSPEQMLNRLTKTGALGGRIRPVSTREGVAQLVSDALGAAGDVATLPLQPFRRLSEAVETAPRLAAYRLARQAGKSEQEATLAFRDITMDFSRGGDFAKTANLFIPFFNAAFQAPENFVRLDLSKGNRAKTAMGIAMAVVLPTIASEAYNRGFYQDDYQDVPDYLKDNGFIVMYPGEVPRNEDGTKGQRSFMWIPRPQHLNFIANGVQRIMEHAYGDDHRTWSATARSILGGLIPTPFIESSFPANMLPPVARTSAELMTNKDLFRNREIVPEPLTGLPVEEQYTDATSAFGRAVGGAIQKPPAAVDYAVTSLGGGVGRQFLNASNGLARLLGVDAAEPQRTAPVLDTPVLGETVGSIFRRSGGQLTTNAIADLERQAAAEKADLRNEFEKEAWWKELSGKERQSILKRETDAIDRRYAEERRRAREAVAYRD